MSSVPIKFIIHLFDSDKKCSDSPKLVPPTRPDKSCVAIPLDTGYSEEISAEVGDPEVRLERQTEHMLLMQSARGSVK